jgi:hypothetical protein
VCVCVCVCGFSTLSMLRMHVLVVAVEYTGNNLLRAVTLYNQRPASAPIDYIRVCLVIALPRCAMLYCAADWMPCCSNK